MALVAAPPDVIRWSPRSAGHGDCAVAALELACGVTYEVALSAALGASPTCLTDGLTWNDIKRAAKLLGFKSRLQSKYALDEDTGILNVIQGSNDKTEHVVYLWEGRIIEPMDSRRQLWLNPQQFLEHYEYKAKSLLVILGEEGLV